ncbi:phosphoserine phosphatase [Granulicella aggregans]|uniref:Phosphoserine phosphatase n=1 Tax=Granulicella aggregans TaxID=474949 RepID=A0A7W7ZHC7_9BACT|nr:haloacid dehalogenase-like hydrolase [Granulicella aggregans]MBB5059811.1 phosphoserine phosphatase [Granulicella aggregans]
MSTAINRPPFSTLSTEEFHAAVHELNPAIAVFDCDGTLWSGDAGSTFMHWTIETGLLSRDATDWLDARYRGYARGEVSEVAICGEMVQVYHGLAESELRQSAARFFTEKIERNIFPEMLALVTELQQRGTEIWAVSSTNDWVIEEGVKRFSIPANRVLSARVAIENGIVTDRLLDVPTDEGKVRALLAAGVVTPDAVFGNSVHDAAMLAIARRAFPVNPTAALVERSTMEGWPVYLPVSIRRP